MAAKVRPVWEVRLAILMVCFEFKSVENRSVMLICGAQMLVFRSRLSKRRL
jgi:hypothetical protein